MENKKPSYFIEPATGAHSKLIDCLAIKAPLFKSDNNIAGVQGISISMENISFNQVLEKFIYACQEFKLALEPSKMILLIRQIMQSNNCKKQWDKETRLFDYGKVKFTFREAQCLHFFLNHYSAEKTANEIFISRKTVEFHLANIKQKLNCCDVKELTNLAIDYGFIDLMFMKF
ncbi:MAG: helix-turn-helix domain-containing protein [Tatlockia sp.]|nr:helix-turn-helix domain-containing protein [Tatlockia sp.]